MKRQLTRFELDQVLWAVSQFTDANARDLNQMRKDGLTTRQAKALCKADLKLRALADARDLLIAWRK